MPITTIRPTISSARASDPFPPTDPLIARNYRGFGPRGADAEETWTNNLGVHAISNRSLKDRLFSFAEGTALGLRMEDRVYDSTDPYVVESEFRRCAAESLTHDQSGASIVFKESTGLAEWGAGLMSGFRITAAPFIQLGWSVAQTASSLLRYRYSRPLLNGQEDSQAFLPFSAKDALSLAPGTEFEICGQGRVVSGVGLGLISGQILRVAGAGGGVAIGATGAKKDEVSLTILRLNQPGHVRIIMRKVDEESATLTARFRAGLVFLQGAVTGVIAGGYLRFFTEKAGAPHFEEFLNLYTTLNLAFASGYAHRGLELAAWDLDLNDPGAREAYENILFLNALPLENQQLLKNKAITEVRLHDNETQTREGVDLGTLGQKLFAYEGLETAREGHLLKNKLPLVDYRSTLFTRRKKNILTGTQEVNWESTCVDGSRCTPSAPYLRLQYYQKNWDFGENHFEQFLKFANTLGISAVELGADNNEELTRLKAHFSMAAEVRHTTDIFITNRGVANLSGASYQEAKDAFLRASSLLRKAYRGFDFTSKDIRTTQALAILDEYSKLRTFNASKLWELAHHHHLHDDYKELTGRNLQKDASLISQAKRFAETVNQRPNPSAQNQIADFLRSLCAHDPLHYMPTVLALSQLAGRTEMLINTLSLTANNVTITNVSQGKLEGPRDAIAFILHRAATDTT